MPTFPALTQQKRTKNINAVADHLTTLQHFNPESQDNATLHSSKKQPYYQFWQLNWYYPSLVPDSDLSSDFACLVAYSNLSSDFGCLNPISVLNPLFPCLVPNSVLNTDFASFVPNSDLSTGFTCLVANSLLSQVFGCSTADFPS